MARALDADAVRDRIVLEVGSQNVNGSPRSVLDPLGPRSYLGVDLSPGPGVDECLSADRLVDRFGRDAFDIVLATEMLEHVVDWRSVVANLKGVLKPGGLLLVTTRSKGYPFHAYPHDYWRYELDDMRHIFSDFEIELLQADPVAPGVFLGRSPWTFVRPR